MTENKLTYTLHAYDDSNYKKELSYDEALDAMLSSYKDNDMTRDMLSTPNNIRLNFGFWLQVSEEVDEHTKKVLMAGLWNMLPNGVGYDDNGNRCGFPIKE